MALNNPPPWGSSSPLPGGKPPTLSLTGETEWERPALVIQVVIWT